MGFMLKGTFLAVFIMILLAQPLLGTQSIAVPDSVPPSGKNAVAFSAVRGVLAAIRAFRCNLVRSELAENGTVSLRGVVGRGAPEEAIQRALGYAALNSPIEWRVSSFEGPFCRILDTLHPIAQSQGEELSFSIGLRNGNRVLRDGELITIDLQLPNFPAWLLVDYFESDGTAVHLHPTAKDAARPHLPSSHRAMGDPSIGQERWEVGAPYGTDMIVAIASSVPLFPNKRKPLEETDDYLRALRAAVEYAQAHNATLAADVVLVVTGPRSN